MPGKEFVPTPGTTRERYQRLGYSPVSIIGLGDTNVVFMQEPHSGKIVVDPVHPVWDETYLANVASNLPESKQHHMGKVDASQITIAQVDLSKPSVTWLEKLSGADELSLSFSAKNSRTGEDVSVEVTQDELIDLFTHPEDASAAFFAIETTEQEITGIALKRKEPILLFIPPEKTNDGRLSASTGFNKFLDSVYKALTENPTALQYEVDEAIFQATLTANKDLEFYHDGSPRSKFKAEMNKRMYQVTVLLVALRAAHAGGRENPELVTIAPFLTKDYNEDNGNGGITLFGRGSKKDSTPAVVINETIISSAIEPFSTGLVSTQIGAETVPGSVLSQAEPYTPPQAQVKVQSRPQVEQAPAPTPRPARPERRQLTEKQKAILLARDLDRGLQEALFFFRDADLDKLNIRDVLDFHQKIDELVGLTQKYAAQRPRQKPPVNPTECRIGPRSSSAAFTGVSGEWVYSFLTGNAPVRDFKEKIEAAFEAWQGHILPVYEHTNSRSQRTLEGISSIREIDTSQLVEEVSALVAATVSQEDFNRIQVLDVAHIILSSQVLYSLSEQFRQLKRSGQSEEIDNWATYTYSTLRRIQALENFIPGLSRN